VGGGLYLIRSTLTRTGGDLFDNRAPEGQNLYE
jgi:hypothetical protein